MYTQVHKRVAAVFLDIKKAFDSVPHQQLILALHCIGIQGPLLNWFWDYLTSRYQRVVLDGVSPDFIPVTSGVPQGSILVPLIFNIFMNSISSVPLSGNCRIVLYADDVLLFKPIDSESDLSDFQTDLENIISWMTQHGLTPNCDKTHLLPISRSRACLPPLTLMINGHILSPCTSVKYLSVTLSNNLTWGAHIDNVCNSTKRQIGCIHRQLHYAPPQLRHKIYITTTLPKLEYCSAVWDPHHVKRRQQLEYVQKFAG